MSGLEIADCPFCGRCVTLTAVSADCLIDFDNFQTDICGRKIVSATWKADAVLRHIVVAAIYFSTRNIVVTDANFVGAVETKVYFTAVDHPPAVSVLSDIVVAEINFAATKYPPSIFIFLYGVAVEIDFTADNAPRKRRKPLFFKDFNITTLASHARGPRFESVRVHQNSRTSVWEFAFPLFTFH